MKQKAAVFKKYNTRTIIALYCLFIGLITINIIGAESYNSIRIFMASAHMLSDKYVNGHKPPLSPSDPAFLPSYYNYDGMLARAKNAGYTHVYAEFIPNSGSNYQYLFHDAFVKAEKFGLKLIPGISLTSGHSKLWSYLNDYTPDPSVIMNKADFTINDNTTGNNENQIDYQTAGGWTYDQNLSGPYKGDQHRCSTKNNYFTIKFSGRQIKLYGKKQSNCGKAAISIDNGSEYTIDQYSATTTYQVFLYKSPLLSDGIHTLKFRVKREKNSYATDYWVNIDYIQVQSSETMSSPYYYANYFSTKVANLLISVKTAFEQAKTEATAQGRPFVYNTTLDYIFFNFDESYFLNFNYNFNVSCRTKANWTTLSAYSNPDDQNYITKLSPNKNKPIAFRELYAININSLLTLIQQNVYSSTKMMIFADMFDPEFAGSWIFNTFLNKRNGSATDVDVIYSPNDGKNTDVLDLPGLTTQQKTNIKANVILCPWMYGIFGNGNAGIIPYNADIAFQYFTSKGYKTVFTSSLSVDKGSSAVQSESFRMLDEYTSKAKKPIYKLIGSFATNYACCMDGPWNGGNCPGPNCRCGTITSQETNYWDNINGVYSQPVEYSILERLAQKMGFYPNNLMMLPNIKK